MGRTALESSTFDSFMEVEDLPDLFEVRRRIEDVRAPAIRFFLMATYLWCARSSEVCGVAYPGDTTRAYGPRGLCFTVVEFQGEKVALFKVRTAKHGGTIRVLPLPLNPVYEPWTKPLCKFLKSRGEEMAFPFTRQFVHDYLSDEGVFTGLTYTINPYKRSIPGSGVAVIGKHSKPFKLHAIRHLRTSVLIWKYGLHEIEACAYGGWKVQSATQSRPLARYIHLNWQNYAQKLFKPLVVDIEDALAGPEGAVDEG